MKKNIVLWGFFSQYELFKSKLKLEELKGTIQIAAVIFVDHDIIRQIDGYPVIKKEKHLT